MSTRALGCRPVGQAVGTSQSYYSTNGGFQAGHTCLRRKRRQHQGSGRDVHMQAKAERRLQRIENRWPSLKQVKLCPRPTNARRAYASAASDASASTSTFHSAAPVTGLSEVNPQKGDGITSDKSLAPLEAQAQDLLSLLIDGTGRNPGKQRQISWADREGGAEEEEEWMKRLDWAAKQGLPSRNTVVAVLGDSQEDLAKFTQALLSDPLASDQRLSRVLASRVTAAKSASSKESIRAVNNDTLLSDLEAPSTAAASRILSSPYLTNNRIELREIVFDSASTSISPQAWTALMTSDIIIVQADPPAPSDVYKLLQKKNVIFTSPGPIAAQGSFRTFQSVTSNANSCERQVMPINVDQALKANKHLESGAQHSLSSFSDASLHSGMPQISEHLANLAASPVTHLDTTRNILARAILDMASNLAAAHQLLYEAEGKVSRLVLAAARDRRHSEIELGFTDLDKLDLELLVADTPRRTGGTETAGHTAVIDTKATSTQAMVGQSDTGIEEVVLLEDGTKGVETALNSTRLTWWKLPIGRADDIATDLAISLSSYFAGLERKLIFETGRLAERSLDLSLQVNSLLKNPPFSRPTSKTDLSYYSATMENEIAALSPTTQFGFPPPSHPSAYNLSQTSLSEPIEARRTQLKAAGGAIERLQLRAQRSVVQFYTLSGSSTAAAVFLNQTSWLQLHQDVPFCVGLAGLGIAAAAWRLQGGWKKAKSKFWTDWKRAQEGLASELQSNADEVLSHKVFVKADVACKVIRKHLAARKDGLRDLESRLRRAQMQISDSTSTKVL